MSRRVDYLNYLLNGGDSRELPAPASREDEVLYEACVNGGGVKTGAGAEGFYRCKVETTGAGLFNFIGGFLDLGEVKATSVKVKAVVTVRNGEGVVAPTQLGLRLFANNNIEREIVAGGYNVNKDNLQPAPVVGTKYTLEANFGGEEGKDLSANRYLKPFIALSRKDATEKALVDVESLTIEVNGVIHDITATIFNFQEGLASDFKYVEVKATDDAMARMSKKFFGKKIATLGDSLTEGYDPAKKDGSLLVFPWRLQLREKCGFLNVKNYGATGRMLSKDKDENVKSLVNLVSDINAFPVKDLDAVTVLIGINDLAQGVPVGEFVKAKAEGEAYKVDTFYGALQTLFEKLLQRVGTEKPIGVINMLNANNSGVQAGVKTLGLTVEEGINAYRETIRVCAKHYGLPVLELQDVVGFDLLKEEDNKTYSGDLLHPNQEGHNKIADAVANFLLTL